MKTAHLGRQILRNMVHYGAQCCWLLRAHPDPAGPGHLDRVHHADLDGDPGGRLPRRAHGPLEDHRGACWAWSASSSSCGRSAATVSTGQLIALAAAVGYAISVILVKSLTRTDRVIVIMFWMVVIQSALGFVPALAVWQWPSAASWGWLLVIGFCGTYSHYCLTQALLHADATSLCRWISCACRSPP